jgi:hypothetical protein
MLTGLYPMHPTSAVARLPLPQAYLVELFAGHLPNDAAGLQFKEGSQNFAGIQPSVSQPIVYVPGFLRAPQLITYSFYRS